MEMSDGFTDPHKKLQGRVDNILGKEPIELSKVQENLKFIREVQTNPVHPDAYNKKVFGCVTVDMSNVMKGKIWDRNILTTDKICRMFLKWRIEQLLKYEKKRRKVDSKMLFILLLVGLGGFGVFVMLMLLGVFG